MSIRSFFTAFAVSTLVASGAFAGQGFSSSDFVSSLSSKATSCDRLKAIQGAITEMGYSAVAQNFEPSLISRRSVCGRNIFVDVGDKGPLVYFLASADLESEKDGSGVAMLLEALSELQGKTVQNVRFRFLFADDARVSYGLTNHFVYSRQAEEAAAVFNFSQMAAGENIYVDVRKGGFPLSGDLFAFCKEAEKSCSPLEWSIKNPIVSEDAAQVFLERQGVPSIGITASDETFPAYVEAKKKAAEAYQGENAIEALTAYVKVWEAVKPDVLPVSLSDDMSDLNENGRFVRSLVNDIVSNASL